MGPRQSGQKGQGVLEFVVVSSSILFFIFLFVNLCYVFLVTQYIDYAVFMSARSLFAAHHKKDFQYDLARMTLERMLGLDVDPVSGVFGPLVKIMTPPTQAVRAVGRYPNPKSTQNTVAGVRLEYEVPVFLVPPIGIVKTADIAKISRMTLVSETYMGREPTQNECYEYLESFASRFFKYLSPQKRGAMVREASDNGC